MALTSETLLGSGIETPSGYTHAASTLTIADYQSEVVELTIAASGVINADPAVGFAALDTAVKAAIDGTNLPGFGVDTSGNDVEAQYNILKITRDFGVSEFGTTDNFVVIVRVNWVVV